MIPYTPLQLLFFFYIYCFCGWIIESTYVSLRTRKLTNRGFMRGPFIPIYGFGAMTLLLVGTPLKPWPWWVFLGGMLAASVLEYFTGVLMEAVFKVRYWDYTGYFMNINGHVCLFNSLCWGVLADVLIYFLHRPVEALSEFLTRKELILFTFFISVYFVCDLTLSFKAAFDLRAIIIKMEKAKDDLRLIRKRMDVILAYANLDREEFVEERMERVEDIVETIEARFEEAKERMEEMPSEFAENIKEEIAELREKLISHRDNHFGLPEIKGFYKRGIFSGNPGIASKKFSESLARIKDSIKKGK